MAECYICGNFKGHLNAVHDRRVCVPCYSEYFAPDWAMQRAFADVADVSNAANATEVIDVVTVWNWIQERGGTLSESEFITSADYKLKLFSANRHGANWLHTAAEWVRQQEEER